MSLLRGTEEWVNSKTLWYFIKVLLRRSWLSLNSRGSRSANLLNSGTWFTGLGFFCHDPVKLFFHLVKNSSAHTDQTKIQKPSYLFYAWKHRDWFTGTKTPYKSWHHKNYSACATHYKLRHCLVYTAYYDNYNYLVFGKSETLGSN